MRAGRRGGTAINNCTVMNGPRPIAHVVRSGRWLGSEQREAHAAIDTGRGRGADVEQEQDGHETRIADGKLDRRNDQRIAVGKVRHRRALEDRIGHLEIGKRVGALHREAGQEADIDPCRQRRRQEPGEPGGGPAPCRGRGEPVGRTAPEAARGSTRCARTFFTPSWTFRSSVPGTGIRQRVATVAGDIERAARAPVKGATADPWAASDTQTVILSEAKDLMRRGQRA